MKYWCAANSNLAYFIELTTALECQKQLLMSSISNLGGRESVEIAVRMFNLLNSGSECLVHDLKVINRIIFFWLFINFCNRFLYVFPQIRFPYIK